MGVTHLFIKHRHGAAVRAAMSIYCGSDGVSGNVPCAPFRQVLITSRSVTAQLGLKAGDLRENIVLDFDRLYELPSGTVVKIGEVLIRLTFHCEPCKKVLEFIDFDRILHRRGVFGTFLSHGKITVDDKVTISDQRFEPIPYAIGERIRWFLRRHGPAAAAVNLVHEIGLPASSARVVPRMLQKLAFVSGASKSRAEG